MTITASPAILNRLRSLIDEEMESLIQIRHDLHAHPELGYDEHRTSEVVQRELSSAGIEFASGLAGGTGVLAHLAGGSDRAVGLRADMDALPILEETGLPYASTNPGLMHACGHDGHTTILIGAARVLARLARESNLPNPVIFAFQPAEEGGGGGKRMVEEGCLDGSVLGAPVRAMFGLHGWPAMPLGYLGTRPGPLLAAADRFDITVRGLGCHAAFPHFGRDPVVAASAIVQSLQTIVARNTSPTESLVVSVTQVHGGTTHNVIPGDVVISGTVRSLASEVRDMTIRRLNEIAQSSARAYGCEAEVDYIDGYPVTLNNPETTATFRRIARDHVGNRYVDIPAPFMGAEDFSYYCHAVPACFFVLGLNPDSPEEMAGLHHPRFDFTDEAMPLGIEMFCRLALSA